MLHGILRDAGYVQRDCSANAFAAVGDAQWRAAFKVDRVAGREAIFTGTMDTDGTAANFHFERPAELRLSAGVVGESSSTKKAGTVDPKAQRKAVAALLAKHPDADVVAIDPGRSNIIYAVKRPLRSGVVDYNAPLNVYKLTRRQYYLESGIVRANKRSAAWQATSEMQAAQAALATASPKGAGVNRFLDHVSTVLAHYDTLWNEHLKPRWAQQRLRLYGGKKRTFARFFNRLKGTSEKVLMAYGAAKFAPTGAGELSVPTSRAFKECASRFDTTPVDEFRTTALWNGDKETVLQTVARKGSAPGASSRLH